MPPLWPTDALQRGSPKRTTVLLNITYISLLWQDFILCGKRSSVKVNEKVSQALMNF